MFDVLLLFKVCCFVILFVSLCCLLFGLFDCLGCLLPCLLVIACSWFVLRLFCLAVFRWDCFEVVCLVLLRLCCGMFGDFWICSIVWLVGCWLLCRLIGCLFDWMVVWIWFASWWLRLWMFGVDLVLPWYCCCVNLGFVDVSLFGWIVVYLVIVLWFLFVLLWTDVLLFIC